MEFTEISAGATDAKSFQLSFLHTDASRFKVKPAHSSFTFDMDNKRSQKSKDTPAGEQGLHDVAGTAVEGKLSICSTST